MNDLPDIPPASRSWREIPQQVKPRAMSREGRRRYVVGAVKTTVVIAFVATLVAGGGWLAKTWSANPALLSAMSGQPPVGTLVLETNGRLNQEWVRATLALPAKITLMEVDLAALRARLVQNPQVSEATVSKIHPASLAIRLTERAPVARLAAPGGEMMLVSRDGVTFPGACFSADEVAALPLLTGVGPDAHGGVPAMVAGMDTVADLLARARDLAPHLLARWTGLDVSRLESDGLIEVRSADIPRIIFSKT
jgi:cell division septal protein FtsQ